LLQITMLFDRRTIVSRAALLAIALVLAACNDSPTPPGGAPMTHELVDDFAGNAVDGTKWQFYLGDASAITQNNRLVVTPQPNVQERFWGLMYRLPHRFTGSSFYAEVGQAATGLMFTETFVAASTLDSQEFVIIPSLGGRIGAWYRWGARECNDPLHRREIRSLVYCQAAADLTFDPVAHRFRRVREAGGIVHFELSADGTNWSQPSGWSIQHRFTDVGALHGLIGMGTFNADPNPGAAIFENVNTNVPAIPSALVATRTSGTEVQLSWQDRSVNESGFRIERRTPGGTFAQIAEVGANTITYQNTGLTAGTTYEYRVRAFNGTGNSGFTNTATAAP
jgi:hypothetical protein